MSEMNLPEHWKTEKLGQLCRVFSGYGFKTKDYTQEGIPLIKIGNLQDGKVIINPENNYIPELWQQNEKLQRFILKSRDILIALTGLTGKTAVVPPSLAGAFLNQRVGKIELISPDAEQDFIFAVTKTRLFQEAIQQNTFRSVQGNISPSSIAQITIPLPPLSEQRAIAHALQTVQAAKAARQRELALEHERKAALMDYFFSYGTKGEPRKQTEIGEIPESWGVVRLEKLHEFIQYGTSRRCNTDKSGVTVLRIPNIVSGKVNIADLKFIEPSEKEFQSLLLEIGDLLFVRTNGRKEYTGRCAVFQGEFQESLFASYLIRVRLKPDTVLPEFVQLYTMTPKGRSYLSGRASNAADGKFNINTQTIKSVLIPVPVSSEQCEIVETCRAFDIKISALEQEAERLDELFRAMLDELMTGKRSTVSLIDVESAQSA